jgi:hypothetical protein
VNERLRLGTGRTGTVSPSLSVTLSTGADRAARFVQQVSWHRIEKAQLLPTTLGTWHLAGRAESATCVMPRIPLTVCLAQAWIARWTVRLDRSSRGCAIPATLTRIYLPTCWFPNPNFMDRVYISKTLSQEITISNADFVS